MHSIHSICVYYLSDCVNNLLSNPQLQNMKNTFALQDRAGQGRTQGRAGQGTKNLWEQGAGQGMIRLDRAQGRAGHRKSALWTPLICTFKERL